MKEGGGPLYDKVERKDGFSVLNEVVIWILEIQLRVGVLGRMGFTVYAYGWFRNSWGVDWVKIVTSNLVAALCFDASQLNRSERGEFGY